MATTSWTDTPNTFCYDTTDAHADEECGKYHPATEIIPDRYAYWVIDDEKASYYAAGRFEDFVIEVRDLVDDEAAICQDIATGEEMDAAVFVARFAEVAA